MIKQLMVAGALAAALTPAVAGSRGPNYYARLVEIQTRRMNRDKCMPDFHRLCAGQQARNNAMARCLGHLQPSLSVACGPVVTDWCNEGLC